MLHHSFKLACDSQLVLNDDISNVINSTFQFFAPDRSPSQFLGGQNVVDKEAIDVTDRCFFIDICGQKFCVTRLSSSVTADIQVVAILCGDQSDIFALCFGAFSCAARHSHFDFVRRTNALVSILNTDREPYGILNTVPTPC